MIVSDIGSFPGKKGHSVQQSVENIMELKLSSGLDIPIYPQMRDMISMFSGPVNESREWKIGKETAVIEEVEALEKYAKKRHEETGKALEFGLCITGPLELYYAMLGTIVDEEVLLNLAKSANRFAKNYVFDKPHIKTKLVSLDEPSLGVNPQLYYSPETIIKALDASFEGVDALRQIHLHAAAENDLVYSAKHVDVLGVEAAENPRNLLLYSKKELEQNDKFIRVGISRTNFFALEAEAEEQISPELVNKLESVKVISKRFQNAKQMFGERLKIVGPDCGLGGWPSQESAFALLENTVKAVKG